MNKECFSPRQIAWLNRSALVLALGWLLVVAGTLTQKNDDFRWYWQAAVNFHQTGNPYLSSAYGYCYPPLLVYFIHPLSFLSSWDAQRIWFGLNLIFLASFSALSLRLSGSSVAQRYWGVVVLALVVAPPTRLSLQLGQISILLALILAGSFSFARHKAPFAGFLLALASLIKIFPAFLGGYYFLYPGRKVVWWSLIGAGFILSLSLLLYGIEPYLAYWHSFIMGGRYIYEAEHNISFTGFWYRLFITSRYAVPLFQAPILAQVLVGGMSLGTLGLCFWSGGDFKDDLDSQLQFGVWLCGMMLVSPANGYYSLILLLPILLTVMHYLEKYPDPQVRTWLILGTALCCIPPGWSSVHPAVYYTVHVKWGLLLFTPAFYGLCIYFWLLVWLTRRLRSTRQKKGVEEIWHTLSSV